MGNEIPISLGCERRIRWGGWQAFESHEVLCDWEVSEIQRLGDGNPTL